MKLAMTMLCLLAATTAAGAAGEIPDVRTLEELLAVTPVEAAGGWKVRIGLSDGGAAAGPVMVLYCVAEEMEAKVRTPATRTKEPHGERIGPLIYDVDWGALRTIHHREEFLNTARRVGPALSAATVRLNTTGKAILSVRDTEGNLIAQRAIVIAERPPVVWHEFARKRRVDGKLSGVVANDPRPAIIRITGHRSHSLSEPPEAGDATTKSSTRPSPLPFDVGVEPDARARLSLAFDGGAFVVKSPRADFTDRSHDRLLARWWVNGRPVAADKVPPKYAQQHTGQERMTDTLRVGFGLPNFLGDVKVGDRIRLQVLYAPDGFEPAPMGQAVMMQQIAQVFAKDARPMLSNRIEFELTDALLAEKDHPRETEPK
jgi:hypothetical protein